MVLGQMWGAMGGPKGGVWDDVHGRSAAGESWSWDTVEVVSCRAPSTRGPSSLEEQVQKAKCRGRGRTGQVGTWEPCDLGRGERRAGRVAGAEEGREGGEVGNEKGLSGGGGDRSEEGESGARRGGVFSGAAS